MSPSYSLHDHVRLLLRSREPAVLSDREAVAALRPYGQGVQAAPADPPVNQQRATVGEPSGALGERVFEGVPEFTPQ